MYLQTMYVVRTGPSEPGVRKGGGGGPSPPPQILADMLTLFQSGGRLLTPTTLLLDPRIFGPSYGPAL